jgi:hypothetical protein
VEVVRVVVLDMVVVCLVLVLVMLEVVTVVMLDMELVAKVVVCPVVVLVTLVVLAVVLDALVLVVVAVVLDALVLVPVDLVLVLVAVVLVLVWLRVVMVAVTILISGCVTANEDSSRNKMPHDCKLACRDAVKSISEVPLAVCRAVSTSKIWMAGSRGATISKSTSHE